MSLLGGIRRGLEQAMRLADDARQLYFSVSAKAVEQSNARLGDLSKLSRPLGPRLRHFVAKKIDEFQGRLDALNCSLAERALPGDRRDRVRQLGHKLPRGRENLHIVGASTASRSRTGAQEPASRRKKPATPKAAAVRSTTSTPASIDATKNSTETRGRRRAGTPETGAPKRKKSGTSRPAPKK